MFFLLLEFPTTVFGDAMRQQVEDRLAFYETGEVPKKNVEVMGTAVEEVISAAISLHVYIIA